MRRSAFVVPLLGLAFLNLPLASLAQAPPKPAPKERRAAPAEGEKAKEEKDKEKTKEKRVYTNDDLEAGRDRPSAVQDLTATGVEPYTPPQPLQEVERPTETRPAAPELSEQEVRIRDLEANIKSLDDAARGLLWQYLQSTDTEEILRLKAEQQSILDQLEEAKAELARLKGEATGAPVPRVTPTPPPG